VGPGVSHTRPLDVARLKTHMPLLTEHTYTSRNTILYALGVGASATGDHTDLRFVYEEGLEALPTMAVVLAYPGFWQQRPEFGLDWRAILHAEQQVIVHRPLAPQGRVRGVTSVDRIDDKGRDKGALLYVRREVRDADTDELLSTIVQGSFLRGNGGFRPAPQPSPRPEPVPDRPPDACLELPTSPQQAVLYRLSGDLNPLHVDPEVARAAGLQRPILHGLCTFGIAARAVLRLLCDDRADSLRGIGGRFTAPVFPGDTLVTEVWRTGSGEGMFRCRVKGTDVPAIDAGTVRFR
jgi:acyl dehydratase